MIFPFLRGFIAPHLAPFTYFLFAINLFVFVATMEAFDRADSRLDKILADSQFLSTQGSAFAVMIYREPAHFTPNLRKLASNAQHGDSDARSVLGNLALRNNEFMSKAEKYEFGGDEVALESWRKSFSALKETQDEHPSYQWGISQLRDGWHQWVSYQFSHSGVFHLFWNMIFLVLFGAFVETKLGASFVILTYLGGGVFGALLFSILSGVSSSPLVGASAAVSGLMGLVGVYWWKREKVSFFYWLLPIKGYFGFVALPSWIVIIVSLLPDLSGYLAASQEFGSVAYAAHLGGAAWGAAMAGFVAIGLMEKEVDDQEENSAA